jgi:hypothetical protein
LSLGKASSTEKNEFSAGKILGLVVQTKDGQGQFSQKEAGQTCPAL